MTMNVTIFLGSGSDFDVIKDGLEILKEFGVPFDLEVTSAHRSPERTLRLVREAEEKGTEVFIAVAGKAAHLAGVVAAHTVRPVIGVPVESAALAGMDALLSTVQMPKGIPVATVALGKAGGANAALLAVQILALHDAGLRKKLAAHRKTMAEEVEAIPGVVLFHAGTAVVDGKYRTNGGRVLDVCASEATLDETMTKIYSAVGKIYFEAMHFRRDIGAERED